MVNKILKSCVTIEMIFLFMGFCVAPIYGINLEKQLTESTFNGNILYVGGSGSGNYTRIQDAINEALDGDTIFVYDESSPYYENLIVDKSINLIGENKETTVIDGDKNGNVVQISRDWVNISRFTLQNSGSNLTDSGIYIISNYNTIKDNNIKHNDEGILIQNAHNNNITCNIITDNDYGLWFSNQGYSNIIIYNNISLNKWWGIRLEASDYNIFSNNYISNNGNGIDIKESDSNYFLSNIITNNFYGMKLSSSNNTTILSNSFLNDDLYVYDSYQNTIFNNTVDGKPLLYLEDKSDIIIDYITGQIIIVNCVNISIQNQELSNIVHSIELWGSKSCIISGNNIMNNHFGIVLIYSSNNNIISNNISNNSYGIILESSGENNTVIKNNIINNGYAVSIIDVSYATFISENKFSNNGYGVHVYKSSDTFITNNTFSSDFFGIYLLFKSNNNTISSNIFLNCGNGIWLRLVSDNKICENTIIADEFDSIGIWLLDSYYCTIINNTITDCLISVQIFNSYSNTIIDNIFLNGGITVYYAFQNNISSNLINGKPVVYLEDTSDVNVEEAGQVILVNCTNILVQNQNLSNAFFGIELWEAKSCHILNNIISNNYQSLYVMYSDFNNISGNDILNYYFYGVNCYFSNENTFSLNDIRVENGISNRLSLYHKISIYFNTILHKFDSQKNQLFYNSILNNINNDLELWGINAYLNQEDISSNTSNGMYFSSCCVNSISENIIKQNQEGIIFEDSSNNMIRGNTLKNNKRGIYFDNSFENTILKNNFKKNKQHAFFIDSKNLWKENYWNRLRFLPKIIFGKINRWDISFPWINIDWRPAKKPYDI